MSMAMEFKPGMIGMNPVGGAEEQHEIEGAESAIQPDVAIGVEDASVGSGEAEKTAPNQPLTPPDPAQTEPEEPEGDDKDDGDDKAGADGEVMHHLTYLAQGIWKDAEGQCWHREEGKKGCITHKLVSESKLEARPDLKFMIKYGAIKDIIVK